MKKRNFKKLIPALAASMMLVGCAKDKPVELLVLGAAKDEVLVAKNKKDKNGQIKTSLPCTDPNDPCLYVPSVVNTPRSVTASRPYWMGEQKLVNIKVNKESIDILELENDTRFDDNALNTRPVITIGASHHDFRCKENANGECGNEQEENDDIPWNQKRYLKLKFDSKTQLKELNFLPAQLDMYFGGCYSPVDARIVKKEVDDDGMNIQAEQDYTVSPNCLDKIQSLSDITFTVKYHFSLRRLSTLASKNYQRVHYGKKDDNTFGFFTTEEHKLSVDNRNTLDGDRVLMNRWNPKRKNGEIPFYLSEGFFAKDENGKEKYRGLRLLTERAIKTVNDSFKKAGTKLKITLKDGRGKDSGDLRNNMIVLVEDPQASGVIGYGPSVTNPQTGEIVHARTVMYLGTIIKFIKSAYEDLRDDQISEKAKKARVEAGLAKLANSEEVAQDIASSKEMEKLISQLNGQIKLLKKDGKYEVIKNTESGKNILDLSQNLTQVAPRVQDLLGNHGHHHDHSHMTNESIKKAAFDINRKIDIDKRLVRNFNLLSSEEKENSFYDVLSKHNAYHGDLFDFKGSVIGALDAGVLGKEFKNDDGVLKEWTTLTKAQQKSAVDKILPFVWVPTLVHEFGHNLGLRHNFNGSEDKANYYTKQELADMGMITKAGEAKEVTYSSIMDYAGNNANELHVLGKYDVAALRFGYARQVEDTEGKMINLQDTVEKITAGKKETLEVTEPLATSLALNPGVKLREYQYCTDEHVSVNAGCNRFDEGSNLVEIAQHWVKAFKDSYRRGHFRKDNKDFSEIGDLRLRGRGAFYMRNLRLMFETYDRIKGMYGLTDAQFEELTKEYEFLKEIKDAMEVAGDFFMEVIKTPDIHCGLAMKSEPTKVLAWLPLTNLTFNDSAITCFDEENVDLSRLGPIGAQVTVAAEAGKHLNNRKDPNAAHRYTPFVDQIDVRGTWLNKYNAMKYLTRRSMDYKLFDKYTTSFLDIEKYRTQFIQFLLGSLNDAITAKAPAITANGEMLEVEIPYTPSITHKINGYGVNGLNRMFGLTSSTNNLFRVLFRQANKEMESKDSAEFNDTFLNLLTVSNKLPQDGSKVVMNERIGGKTYIATEHDLVAQMVIQNYVIVRELNKVDENTLKIIVGEGVTQASIDEVLNQEGDTDGPTLPDTPEVRFAQSLPKEVVKKYLDGEMPSLTHSETILKGLVNRDDDGRKIDDFLLNLFSGI